MNDWSNKPINLKEIHRCVELSLCIKFLDFQSPNTLKTEAEMKGSLVQKRFTAAAKVGFNQMQGKLFIWMREGI